MFNTQQKSYSVNITDKSEKRHFAGVSSQNITKKRDTKRSSFRALRHYFTHLRQPVHQLQVVM